MRHIILGTAGHIDHGKSSLVTCMTGIDPDRLKEEKERGITIDIGFADLTYPDGELTVGIVDVPGHEKLINNMLAGAGGIDMVLLVIAADEGIMPQSREHLAICNMLGIQSGLIAITKTDLVERDWIDLVRDEIREFVKGTFLEDSPIIPVSSRTGEQIDALKEEIKNIALTVAPKSSDGLFRLPIDRVFTLKGFGTVITGTALSGTISTDTPLEILPAGIKSKVRGLHSHGKPIKTAYAGQRVAINLQGVEKENLKRGDIVVTPFSFHHTKKIDVYLELFKEVPTVKNRSLVHFYIGTSETVARIILYEKESVKAREHCYGQLRLQDPVIAMSGDRYIIRRFSPLETLGGGQILDPVPLRRSRKDRIDDLEILNSGTLEQKISLKTAQAGSRGMTMNALYGWISSELTKITAAVRKLVQSGEIMQYEDLLLHRDAFALLRKRISDLLAMFHTRNPLKQGMQKEEVRNSLKIEQKLFNHILARHHDIVSEKNLIRLKNFTISLSRDEEAYKSRVLDLLEKGRFQPPSRTEMSATLKTDQKQLSDILNILTKEGNAIRINENLYLASASYEKMLSLLREFYAKKDDLSVAEFRDLLNTTRKFALPFLEYLDAHNVTIRTGDVRKFMAKG